MKRIVLTTLMTMGTVLTSSATVYWRGTAGQPIDWYDQISGHGRWNTAANGSGTWQNCPVNENAHIKNGGIAVISNAVSGVEKLVLNFQVSDRVSCVRVDKGGSLECTHAYVTHSTGSHGLIHINGGSATIGQTGTDTPGLFAPSAESTSGADGTVLVTGGRLDVYNRFALGEPKTAADVHQGNMIVSNGVVSANCNLVLGKVSSGGKGWVEVAGGRLQGAEGIELAVRNGSEVIQSGGEIVFDDAVPDGSFLSLSGGAADFGKLLLKRGGRLAVSGSALLTGGLTVRGDEAAGATNEIIVSGGTVSVTNFAGYLTGSIPYAWILTENPFRYVQTGGSVNLDRLYFNAGASRDARLAVDGGTFVCGPVCVFDQPFYFRHSGAASVTLERFADKTQFNFNDRGTNCLVEHVIDRGVLKPICFAERLGSGSTSHFNVFGRNVLRPAGGVQVVTNETFSLFTCNEGAAPNAQYCSGVPDTNLWTTERLGKQYVWGSTLTAEACVGAVPNGGSVTFAPTPFGYASLPAVKTNNLARYSVTLAVEPQAATLDEIAEDLTAAGYENVTTVAGDEPTVAFDVPKDWLTDRQSNAKLLFDFTETRCPDQFVTDAMDFPVTTNALVKSVALTINSSNTGLLLLFR